MVTLNIRQNLFVEDSLSHFSKLWNNHQSSQASGCLADLFLVPDSGPVVPVHLAVMLPLSNHLGRLVWEARVRGEHPQLLLPGFSPSTVRSLVSLLYSGSCPQIVGTTCKDILGLAGDLGIDLPPDRVQVFSIKEESKVSDEDCLVLQCYPVVCEPPSSNPEWETEPDSDCADHPSSDECVTQKEDADLDTESDSVLLSSESGTASAGREFKFFCPFCDYRSRQEKYLINHTMSIHSEELFTCQFCQFSTPTFPGLQRHFNKVHSHIEGEDVSCEDCGWRTSKKTKLEVHRRLMHNNQHDTEIWVRGGKRKKSRTMQIGITALNNMEVEVCQSDVNENIESIIAENVSKEGKSTRNSENISNGYLVGQHDVRSRDKINSKGTGLPVIVKSPGKTKLMSHVMSSPRVKWNKEKEVPLLMGWFSDNIAPSRNQLTEYAKIINGSESRLTEEKPVTASNIGVWFMNRRAAVLRSVVEWGK